MYVCNYSSCLVLKHLKQHMLCIGAGNVASGILCHIQHIFLNISEPLSSCGMGTIKNRLQGVLLNSK